MNVQFEIARNLIEFASPVFSPVHRSWFNKFWVGDGDRSPQNDRNSGDSRNRVILETRDSRSVVLSATKCGAGHGNTLGLGR